MSRRMDDLKGAIAEVDDFSVIEQTSRRCRSYTIVSRAPSRRQPVEHFIPRIPIGKRPFIARIGQNFSLRPVNVPCRKFMVAADMIEMRMAGDADKRPFANQRHMF